MSGTHPQLHPPLFPHELEEPFEFMAALKDAAEPSSIKNENSFFFIRRVFG